MGYSTDLVLIGLVFDFSLSWKMYDMVHDVEIIMCKEKQ